MRFSKSKKRLAAFGMITGLICTLAPIAFADQSYWVHIKETGTWYRDMYRSAFWNILTLMASIINCIESAIKEVLSWNIYTKLTEIDPSLNYANVKSVALVISIVAVAFVGILLIINGDKMHIKDTVKNILISLCLVVSFPALMGALDAFMFGSKTQKGYSQTYGVSSEGPTSEGTVRLLGDKILAMELYDNIASVKNKTQKYYYGSEEYEKNGSPRDIDINKLAKQSEIDSKYSSSDTTRRQRKFSELTMNNCVSLLGMSKEYATLLRVKDKYKEGETFPYKWDDGVQDDYTVAKFEQEMITRLLSKKYQTNSGLLEVSEAANRYNVVTAQTFESAVDAIKDDIVWQLNYIDNVNTASGNNTTVNTTKLRTVKDYNKMGWLEQAMKVDLWEPYEDERVYAYDYDFFSSFVDMFIIILCLIFALLKLCRMMWEIAFMHIFVPLVVATDAHGSGRAKRAIQQLITTFSILIVILISLNLYISLIGQMHQIDNLIARWGLVLAGAHFVIDGSDFIVKMTGMDAGIKSGAATLLALRSAAGIAKGIGHAVKSAGGTAAHVGSKAAAIGGNAADHIGGAAVGAVGGAIAGAAGGATAGMEGHSSIAGQAVGTTVGLHTGAAVGAVRGGAEGARRGFMGLIRGNKNSNNSNPQPSESGTSTPTSDSGSQSASSDTGTAAAPPPTDTDTGTAEPPTASGGADTGTTGGGADTGDTGTAAAPQVDSGSEADTDSGSYDAASNDVQREGSLFTRAYSTGSAVGGVTGHPINKGKQAAYKVGSAKAKFDIAKAGGFKDEKAAVSEKVTEIKYKGRNRIADFVKGKYKDNNDGNGGNS